MNIPVCYFPDGTPCPYLMTEDEAIRFLRIDTVNIKDRSSTLRRYREAGVLRGIQISKVVLYSLPKLIAFIDRQAERACR